MLRAAREAGPGDRPGRAGKELCGATLGLVGFGQVARVVAPIARAIGMRVRVASRHLTAHEASRLGVEPLPLPRLMSTSDVVSVHLRAVPPTIGMLDRALLRSMRPDVIFVNTSRAVL